MDRQWIVKALGSEHAIFERLASQMPPSKLWSLLLEVIRHRAQARSSQQVLEQYLRDRFVHPASVDQRVSHEVDGHLFSAASHFEAVELSPVTPLGTCSVIAPTDQHRVLSCLRGTEVVSDPTNVFALECAERLRKSPDATIRLTTSQRVVRAQQVPNLPGYSQHFRIFVLASSGREQRDHAFTVGALVDQINTMGRALDRLELHGYHFGARRLTLLATEKSRAIADRIAPLLTPIEIEHKVLEQPYYSGGVRYMYWVHNSSGEEVPLIDGGAFDWVAQLTNNKRFVYVASGMGAQLIPLVFRKV